MEALARQGRVQFEWKGNQCAAEQPDPLEEPISDYRALAAKYGSYWPPAVYERRCCALPVKVSARAAIRQIESWLSASRALLERLDEIRCEQQSLGLWGPVLESLGGQDLDLGALVAAGPVLTGGCLVLPVKAQLPELTDGLEVRTRFGDRIALLGVIPRERLTSLCREARDLGGECIRFPGWFVGTPRSCCAGLPVRMKGLDREIQGMRRELRRLAEARGIARARGVLERIDWFRTTAHNIQCNEDFCWITGWTSESDSAELTRAALCISNRLWMERSPMALLAGMGIQIESTFSLLLNTLSFARVGAFALAHAALQTAVIAVAHDVSSTAAAAAIVVGSL